MKIAIIVGTRPEIIKMSPIIKYCQSNNIKHDIIHSQQHYSNNMDEIFFENLEIKYPKLFLGVKSKSPHEQISEIMVKCGDIFIKNKYDFVLVQGDTNTVLGAALAANKCGVKIGHVEAGLRSFDLSMPEEVNRILTDNISDYCFCPTAISESYLKKSGINQSKLFVVGNTIVDSIHSNLNKFKNIDITNELKIKSRYALVTLHRPSNVDNDLNLTKIIETLKLVSNKFKYQIVFPVHPRTKNNIIKADIDTNDILIIDPLGYFDFLALIYNSSLILTDSGGIQEEACILKKPCITLRENTERPETVTVGSNILTGLDQDKIIDAVNYWQNNPNTWVNPFGTGNTSEQIINILLNDK